MDYLPVITMNELRYKMCAWMFIAALFIIALNWKQPKHPSTVKWVNKSWCDHKTEYHTSARMNKLQLHV